ncbi:MAG: HD domain-containing protein [Proteobacteria bacterium]|nr:HD domain-containing protein [Pseudomonadota bacterium]MBU2228153.1 HD domain-containing protein [Pseudomonadota bacterium]
MIGEKEIQSLFSKQLSRIKNKKLRDMVVETYVMACQEGGWESVEDLRKVPFTLLTDTKGIDLMQHIIAVTESAIGLAQGQIENYETMPYRIDMDRLVAGGLLHDVGKLVEIQKDGKGGFRKSKNGALIRHPISGAILAGRAGLPLEIVNMIACHAKEGEGAPQVVETVLIHQADFATFNPLIMMTKGLLIT